MKFALANANKSILHHIKELILERIFPKLGSQHHDLNSGTGIGERPPPLSNTSQPWDTKGSPPILFLKSN
jgi:hypothetical protein